MANIGSKSLVAEVVTTAEDASAAPGASGWRGTRIALLCAATAILLLGAAVAGLFGYLTIMR